MSLRPLARTRALRLLGVLALVPAGAVGLIRPDPVSAHQPVVVDDEETEVVDPEISKAYYGTLSGEPQRYRIDSAVAFDLYVGILVPDDGSPQKDVSAEIFRGDEQLAAIGGVEAEWSAFYEPFGQNTYWDGGEYRLRAEPGVYSIRISSPNNDSSYSLAVGEIEFFDWGDRANALAVLPGIQQEFFGLSPFSLLVTPYGLINLLVIHGAALGAALLYRRLLRRPLVRLIGGTPWRISSSLRGAAAVALLVVALGTSWSPVLLFLSGLLLFDALLGRRGATEIGRAAG